MKNYEKFQASLNISKELFEKSELSLSDTINTDLIFAEKGKQYAPQNIPEQEAIKIILSSLDFAC